MQNCTATLENTWAVSSKVKYALCMISNSTPRHLPGKNENICPHKDEFWNRCQGSLSSCPFTGIKANSWHRRHIHQYCLKAKTQKLSKNQMVRND